MYIPLLSPLLAWLRALLFSRHLEICVVGLNAAGKTSLVNVLACGQFSSEMIPTVGFNMRKVQAGNTTIKVWDIGGQARFRNMWERYCRGVSAIVFVVDSSIPLPSQASSSSGPASASKPASAASAAAGDAGGTGSGAGSGSGGAGGNESAAWQVAADELHALVSRPMLAGVPLLVLATKNDVEGAASAEEVIRIMRLEQIAAREVSCYSISSKRQVNIDVTLRWLCARSPAGAR